nr:S26 family signal peptidase [Sphingomonas sp. Y57]
MTGPRSGAADGPLFAYGDALRAVRVARRRLVGRSAAVCVGAAALLATATWPPPRLLLWNLSPSAPEGLYAVRPGGPVRSGEIAVVRLPQPARRLAADLGILPPHVPLVKRVAAVAGMRVCARGPLISIDFKVVARRRTVDPRGRELPRWQGCRTLGDGQIFLLSDHPDAYDGRYFGPLAGSDLIGRAVLLWPR